MVWLMRQVFPRTFPSGVENYGDCIAAVSCKRASRWAVMKNTVSKCI